VRRWSLVGSFSALPEENCSLHAEHTLRYAREMTASVWIGSNGTANITAHMLDG
jgi:hypothetical protein